MKLRIRRVGNSLGLIVPKKALDDWGIGEGDCLELDERSIHPPGRGARAQSRLDDLKRALAHAVVARFSANEIRAKSLANLHHWKTIGSWVSAYDEWLEILQRGNDGELFFSMLGRDERSNRLRRSPPYVGLLPREEVRRLNEEASA